MKLKFITISDENLGPLGKQLTQHTYIAILGFIYDFSASHTEVLDKVNSGGLPRKLMVKAPRALRIISCLMLAKQIRRCLDSKVFGIM